MPTSLAGNPEAFLRGAGGVMPPMGGMMTGAPNAMAGGDLGGGDQGGGGDAGGGGGPPPGPQGFANMGMAAALAPQVLAQQQTEYYKRFLKTVAALLREFMRTRGIGPKTVSTVGRGVTALEGAMNQMDKERPESAGPVESLLASSLMKPGVAQGVGGMSGFGMGQGNRLPIMR